MHFDKNLSLFHGFSGNCGGFVHLLSPLVLHRVTPLDLAQPQLSTPLQHGCPPRLAPAQASADVGCQSRVGFGLVWVSCSRAGQAGGKAGRPPGRRAGG